MTSLTSTLPAHRARPWLPPMTAVEAADLVLSIPALRGGGSVVVEPRGGHHVLAKGSGPKVVALAELDSALGNALVARLAILAGLRLGDRESQLGRIRVRVTPSDGSGHGPAAEVLVAVRTTERGLVAEIHGIGDPPARRRPAADKFRLSDELGRGGMGIVYRAEHIALQREVALKVLLPSLADDPRVAPQFLVEARAAARVRHPSIVEVFDFGQLEDGRRYIAMELVEWPTLGAVLDEVGAMEVTRALHIARKIASALDAARAHGVIHRDLKPANVFVGPDDAVKLADFGVAWILDQAHERLRKAQTGMAWGTLAYMSPEQARGEPTDARTDIYALGQLLARMVLGGLPSGTPTVGSPGTQAGAARLLPRPPGPIPDVLSRVVERATAERPEQRHQTFTEMRADLSAALRTLSRSDWMRWLPR